MAKFHCHPCSQTGLSEEDMKKHIEEKHSKEQPAEGSSASTSTATSAENPLCSECNQDFSNEGYLLQHYKIVHKDIPPGMKNRKQYICEQCGEVYLSQLTLQNHNKRVHTVTTENTCEDCGNVFVNVYEYKIHRERVHADGDNDQGAGKSSAKKKKLNCSHCEKTFVSYARCKEHIRSKHENNTPFQV